MRKFFGFVAVFALFGGAALAADEYKIDPHHSSVSFSVTHMVVSTVNGRFGDFEGKILFDEKDPSKSSVSVKIKAASINTDNTQRDTHLRSGDFLDASNHPEITFESKSIEKRGNGFVAHGSLTIRGVPKDVDLPFEVKGPVNAGPGRKIIGAHASLTINRQDYGVSWSKSLDKGQLVVSNDVNIGLDVEAGSPPPTAGGK